MVATIAYFECPKCGKEMKKKRGDGLSMMDMMPPCPKCGEHMKKIRSEIDSSNGTGFLGR